MKYLKIVVYICSFPAFKILKFNKQEGANSMRIQAAHSLLKAYSSRILKAYLCAAKLVKIADFKSILLAQPLFFLDKKLKAR